MLSYSWWTAKRSDPWATERLILKYHQVHKDEYREKIYSEELLSATLSALSVCINPVADLYRRLKTTSPRDYQVFEDYYKALYHEIVK